MIHYRHIFWLFLAISIGCSDDDTKQFIFQDKPPHFPTDNLNRYSIEPAYDAQANIHFTFRIDDYNEDVVSEFGVAYILVDTYKDRNIEMDFSDATHLAGTSITNDVVNLSAMLPRSEPPMDYQFRFYMVLEGVRVYSPFVHRASNMLSKATIKAPRELGPVAEGETRLHYEGPDIRQIAYELLLNGEPATHELSRFDTILIKGLNPINNKITFKIGGYTEEFTLDDPGRIVARGKFPLEDYYDPNFFHLDGNFYVGSGRQSSNNNSIDIPTLYKFNPNVKQWTAVTDIPGKDNTRMVFADEAYAYMGSFHEPNNMFRYDPAMNVWDTLSNLVPLNGEHTWYGDLALWHEGSFYIANVRASSYGSKVFAKFTPVTSQREFLPNRPATHIFDNLVEGMYFKHEGILYYGNKDRLYPFDPASGQWKSSIDIILDDPSKHGIGAFVYQGKPYVVIQIRYHNGFSYVNDRNIYQINLSDGTLTYVNTLPQYHKSVVVDEKIYLMDYSGSIFEYQMPIH